MSLFFGTWIYSPLYSNNLKYSVLNSVEKGISIRSITWNPQNFATVTNPKLTLILKAFFFSCILLAIAVGYLAGQNILGTCSEDVLDLFNVTENRALLGLCPTWRRWQRPDPV